MNPFTAIEPVPAKTLSTAGNAHQQAAASED